MNNNLAIYDSSLHKYRTNFKDWYIDPDYKKLALLEGKKIQVEEMEK